MLTKNHLQFYCYVPKNLNQKLLFDQNEIEIKEVLNNSTNKKDYGVRARQFRNAKNEYGCIFNADFSFDPKDLKKFIELSKVNDFVFATRYKEDSGSDDDDWITLIGNKVFSFISKNFLRINLSDILYTYVLCNVKKFNSLNLKSNDFRLCIELPFQVSQSKYTYTECSSYERARYGGEKKVNVLKDGFIKLTEVIYSIIKKIF